MLTYLYRVEFDGPLSGQIQRSTLHGIAREPDDGLHPFIGIERNDPTVDPMLDDLGADRARGVDPHSAGAGDVEELGTGAGAVERTVEQGRKPDVTSGPGDEGLVVRPRHGMYDRGARQAAVELIDLRGADDLEGQTRLGPERGIDHRMEPENLGLVRSTAVVEDANVLRSGGHGQRHWADQPGPPGRVFVAQIVRGDPERGVLRTQPVVAPGGQTRELETIAPARATCSRKIEEIVIHEKYEFSEPRTMAPDESGPGHRDIAHEDNAGAKQLDRVRERLAESVAADWPPAGLQDWADKIIGRGIGTFLDQMDRGQR